MAEVFKCPVCYGRGFVPKSFYESQPVNPYQITTTTGATVNNYINTRCRSCEGKGIIIVKNEGEDYTHYPKIGNTANGC